MGRAHSPASRLLSEAWDGRPAVGRSSSLPSSSCPRRRRLTHLRLDRQITAEEKAPSPAAREVPGVARRGRRPHRRGRAGGLPRPREGLPARRLHQALLGGARPASRGRRATSSSERWEANVQAGPRPLSATSRTGAPACSSSTARPTSVVESDCPLLLWPLEVWFYGRSERSPELFAVVLYRKWGAGPFRVWNPRGIDGSAPRPRAAAGRDGRASLGRQGRGGDSAGEALSGHSLAEITDLSNGCGDWEHAQKIAAGIGWVAEPGLRWEFLGARISLRPEAPGRRVGPDLPLLLDRPARGRRPPARPPRGRLPRPLPEPHRGPGRGDRARGDAGQAAMWRGTAPTTSCSPARCCANGELFDSFRYKFDLPAGGGRRSRSRWSSSAPCARASTR